MRKGIEDLLTNEHFRQHILNPNQGESDYWENWAKENTDLYNQAKSLIIDFYQPLSEAEFQSEAIAFKRKIDVTNADKHHIISLYRQPRNHKNSWLLRVAASLLILVSVAFAANWYINGLNQEVTSLDATQKIIKKEAEKGHKLTITFRDGTRVKLNSESYITYPEDFSDNAREVTLSGEAYFEVAHHDNWPFIVKTDDVQTKVLGTSFNISSYPEDCCVKVALVEGKVEVKVRELEPIKLIPHKMAKISHGTEKIEVIDFDLNKITAWKNNKIVFEQASFDEVQSTLERWYNVKFIYDQQPVFEGGYTGEFKNYSLELVLNGMSENKFGFKILGNKVFIN